MRLPELFEACGQARAVGEYSRFIGRIGSVPLLIIDDWGLRPLDAADRHDLVEVMDRRYGQVSTAVVSQLPTDQWHGAIGDATLADAILDRVVHNAHRIRLRGESMRK